MTTQNGNEKTRNIGRGYRRFGFIGVKMLCGMHSHVGKYAEGSSFPHTFGYLSEDQDEVGKKLKSLERPPVRRRRSVIQDALKMRWTWELEAQGQYVTPTDRPCRHFFLPNIAIHRHSSYHKREMVRSLLFQTHRALEKGTTGTTKRNDWMSLWLILICFTVVMDREQMPSQGIELVMKC